MLTINEIFFRKDYIIPERSKTIVDFGSNIGISVLYYLQNTMPSSFVYAYEPVPDNCEKFEKNLSHYQGRYSLFPVAVGAEPGICSFGVEPTGRYGGIGLNFKEKIDVRVVGIEDVLSQIIAKHGVIDAVKIDTESQELKMLAALSEQTLAKIRCISLEYLGDLAVTPKNFSITGKASFIR